MGAECFRLCRQLVDGVVLVDNAATSAAIRDVFNETRSILEPAGAVGVAGAKAYLKRYALKVCTPAIIEQQNIHLLSHAWRFKLCLEEPMSSAWWVDGSMYRAASHHQLATQQLSCRFARLCAPQTVGLLQCTADSLIP